ncbi:hypothetical protein BJP27_14920 [Pseudomonas oryzihabitans]|nr:hypothetical protein BJP27_14920 [Pseudomonas psychrotolerans]
MGKLLWEAGDRFIFHRLNLTTQEDHVDQQATTLTAGGNVTLVASKVAAGGEAYLYAGKDLNVLAAQDSDYSLYDKQSKSSFGSKKTKRDCLQAIEWSQGIVTSE